MNSDKFQQTWQNNDQQIELLKQYEQLLLKWQKKINLISKHTTNEIWLRHFYDSMQLLPIINKLNKNNNIETIVDMGSGAGFPAMVLAIHMENMNFILIESDQRKFAFLNYIITNLKLKNIKLINKRIEDVDGVQADIITSRALSNINQLLNYSENLIKNNGYTIFPKGLNFQSELKDVTNNNFNLTDQEPSLSNPESVILIYQYNK